MVALFCCEAPRAGTSAKPRLTIATVSFMTSPLKQKPAAARRIARRGRVRGSCRRQPARCLRGRRDLFLVCDAFDLDAPWFDAVSERKRQLQHPVAIGRADLFDVQELRNRKRLFVSRCNSVFGDRLLSANSQGMTCHIEVDVSRVDAGQGHVNTPPIVGSGRLEGRRLASCGTTWKLIPELVEDVLELPLENEEIVDCVPTGQSKHGLYLLSHALDRFSHAWVHVK